MQDASTYIPNVRTLRPLQCTLMLMALGLVAVLGVKITFTFPGFFTAQDEGILLVYPDLILRGYTPYKDFAALYSPGGSYLIAGAFRVFGESVSVETRESCRYTVLVSDCRRNLPRRVHVNRIIAILSAVTSLCYFSLMALPYSVPHLGAFACMLFAVFYATRDDVNNSLSSKISALLSGAIAGLAFWFKQDLGVIAVLVAMVSINPPPCSPTSTVPCRTIHTCRSVHSVRDCSRANEGLR